MVARKHNTKIRTSRNSSVMVLSSVSKRFHRSLPQGNPRLPNVNVLLSVLMPSNLPPIALSQYNNLTKEVHRKQSKPKETASMGEDQEESTSRPSSSSTLSSTCGSCSSSAPVLDCDEYFSYGMQPYSSRLSIDLCPPGSPISIDNDTIVKIDSSTTKITTAETVNDTQLRKDKLVKECHVVLHPVSSLEKTVYLCDKCPAYASTKKDSFSLLPMSKCPCKEKNTINDVRGINVSDSISEASNLEMPHKPLIEETFNCQLSATQRSEASQQRWLKSVELKKSHYLNHRLSTNISALYGTSTSLREVDEKRKLYEESSRQEENKAANGQFDTDLKLDLKEASALNKCVERETGADRVEVGIPSVEASHVTTLAKPCGQKWVNSVNLERSPLVPKPTLTFMKKGQDFQCEFKSEQNEFFQARGIILHEHERRAEMSQINTQINTPVNVSGDERRCPVETTTCSSVVLNKEEGACNVSRSESDTGNTLKCVQNLNSAIPITPSLKEGLAASGGNGQGFQKDENDPTVTRKEKYRNTKMSHLKLLSSENEKSQPGVHENTQKQHSAKRESLPKMKGCVQHKRRKRSSSESLLPGKRRLRTFSLRDFRDPQNFSVKTTPFVKDQCIMADSDDLIATKTSHDLTNETLEKTVDFHDWLLCDRSVDSIPEEDEREVRSQPAALNESLQIVFQDHTYSRKSHEYEAHRHCLNSKDHHGACLANTRSKKMRACRQRSNTGKAIKVQKKAKKIRKLSKNALQKNYNPAVPLKELTVNCERLIPDNYNILKIPNNAVRKKNAISTKKKKKKKMRREKRKAIDDNGAPQPKRPRVPLHYKTFKPDQINTIKHIGMRYRVAFHLWPHKYSNALQIINQRIINQNAFWETIQ